MRRIYAAIYYDHKSSKLLREWCMDHGFDLTKDYDGNTIEPKEFAFHTTIFLSTNKVDMSDQNKRVYGRSYATDYELLGKNKDVPVLRITSPELDWFYNHFSSMGLQSSFSTFKPHVTLSYSSGVIAQPSEIPSFPLDFGRLVVKGAED